MIEINKKTLSRIFMVIAGGIVFYWLLHETENVKTFFGLISKIFSPFVGGAALAFVLNVPVRGFERQLVDIKKPVLKRMSAILLTLIMLCLVITLVFVLLIPQLIATVDSLIPQVIEFVTNLGNKIDAFLRENPELFTWIQQNTNIEKFNWAALVQNVLKMVGDSLSSIASHAVSAIGSVTGTVVNLVISIVFAVYCLFQKETLARQGRKVLYAFLPESTADYVIRVLHLTNSTFSNFLSGQCIEVCILGSMFAISMAIFHMPYIPLVSVLVAVTAFIPVVGAWIGCICGAFLILVDDVTLAMWFVLMFLILQQIENNMIYPRVVGTSIGLSGMWVLLAVTVGGKLMGVAGMFLMIPAASVIYTLFSEYTRNRLAVRDIAPEKLVAQPPELNSKFLFRRKKKKINNTLKSEVKETK